MKALVRRCPSCTARQIRVRERRLGRTVRDECDVSATAGQVLVLVLASTSVNRHVAGEVFTVTVRGPLGRVPWTGAAAERRPSLAPGPPVP